MSNASPQQSSSTDTTYRVLLISSHPVQYGAPIYRRLAHENQLDILVAYCSMQGAEQAVDIEFGVEIAWDIPLLECYPWLYVPNRSPRPGLGHFFGLINPDLGYLIHARKFDAVVVYTGYRCASFWIALIAAKLQGAALLFGTDAHTLELRHQGAWKKQLKERVWPLLFRLADVVVVPSRGGVALMRALGIPANRVALTPYVVDNSWWLQQALQVDRATVRAGWAIPADDVVTLFCAKLQPWKRPQDVLQAFAAASVPNSWLVYAGEGPLRPELEQTARALNIADRVRFLGFMNQSQLPAIYVAADLLVLPSAHEPFGVVVNEAMLCGRPAIVSDQVGAGADLVQPGVTGFVYPAGDCARLTILLRELLPDKQRLQQMGAMAQRQMESWSPSENIAALTQAVKTAIALKHGAAHP